MTARLVYTSPGRDGPADAILRLDGWEVLVVFGGVVLRREPIAEVLLHADIELSLAHETPAAGLAALGLEGLSGRLAPLGATWVDGVPFVIGFGRP